MNLIYHPLVKNVGHIEDWRWPNLSPISVQLKSTMNHFALTVYVKEK